MKKQFFSVLSLLAVIALAVAVFPEVPASAQVQKPDNKIPGQYIVVFKDTVKDVDKDADDLVKSQGLGHLFTYRTALKGFAAVIPDNRLGAVKNDPRVAFVTQDREVTAFGKPGSGGAPPPQPSQIVPTGIRRINAPANANKGAGVGVAVIDTGIDLTHPDLAGVVNGTTCIRRTSTANDDNGHGTHVAGTIGARNNTIGVVGVAPEVSLIAVKVLDKRGSGSWSSVICGIDWVTANATSSLNIKVANMSLGGSGTSDSSCGSTDGDALHQAICRSSRNAGVTYVVAAGNSSANANTSVPAAYDDAVITVSALADSDGKSGGWGPVTSYGPDDTFATFSNYSSSIVDLGAPGVSIYSTYKGGGYATMSGTSMASPHVAGSAALYIQAHPGSSWTQVRNGLKAAGEPLDSGHTDPSHLHPEPVVQAGSL